MEESTRDRQIAVAAVIAAGKARGHDAMRIAENVLADLARKDRHVLHMVDTTREGKTLCGVKLTGDNALLPKHAQHATCKRCIAVVQKGFR